MKKSYVKISTWLLLFYSFFAKFCHSLASPLFSKYCFHSDNTIFYIMGKGIMNGLTLYKDMADLKTPYIYFVNAFASIFSYKHIGLYIIESLVLFVTLLLVYKFFLIFIKNDALSFLGAVAMACLLNDTYITLGMSKVECYCLPFILYSFYMAIKYFLSDEKKVSRKDALIYGLLAGASTMFNLKTAFFFIALYIVVLIRMIIKKEKFFDRILFVILGGFISILPYLIYMLMTGSMSYAIYCIFTLSAAYVSGSASYEYVSSSFIDSMCFFVRSNILFFVFIFISLIVVIVKCKNKWIKASFISTFLITLFYVSIANKSYVYYLVIFYPYLIPCYILFVNYLLKIVKGKAVFGIVFMLTIFLTIINFIFGFSVTKNQHDTKAGFNSEMKRVVTKYIDNIESKKVLALAFNPEVYMALDVLPSFPCFITMNNNYEASPNLFMQQAKYVKEAMPDVVVIRPTSTFLNFPLPLQDEIYDSLNKNYKRVEDVDSKSNYGLYNVYIKNEIIK